MAGITSHPMRRALGVGAILLVAAGLNILVWQQTVLSLAGLTCLAAGTVAALAWAVWTALARESGSPVRGRALGGFNSAIGSVLFLAICATLYAFALRWDIEVDLTQEGRRALSQQTVQVLESMTEPVEVLCYFLRSDEDVIRIAQDKTERFLRRCEGYTPLLSVSVLDPQMDPVGLQQLGITRASQQGTVVLRAGERQRVITLTGGSPRLEERAFTNTLINLLRTQQPRVGFLSGHGERDLADPKGPDGAGLLADFLQREAYEVVPISIQLSEPALPEGLDIVAIAGMRGDLHPVELRLLDDFVQNGGRILLLLDPPGRPAAGAEEQLRPWLARRFGIEAGRDLLMRDQPEAPFDVDLRPEAGAFGSDTATPGEWRGSFRETHPITRGGLDPLLMAGVRSVRPVEAMPERTLAMELLRSTPEFWTEQDLAVLAQTRTATKDVNEPAGPHPVAVAAVQRFDDTGEVEARIVVVGNANFAANDSITFPGHLNFLMNAFAWLSESEDLIGIRPTGKDDPPLLLTSAQKRTLSWVSTLFTAQVVLLAGAAVWWFRRRSA